MEQGESEPDCETKRTSTCWQLRDMTGQHPIKRMRDYLARLTHKAKLRGLTRARNKEYQDYLNVQFDRTFSKRNQIPARRNSILMERLVELGDPPKEGAVLCVGPRDGFELEWFKKQGFSNIRGIDLFSQHPDVLVMDMHHMTFPDDTFEVVYASHSLEHSYRVEEAVAEVLRVAKSGALMAVEVPIKYNTRGADRFDFGDVNGVLRLFAPHVTGVLWSDEQEPGTPLNWSGTAIVRTVFRIEKEGRGNGR